MQNIATPAQHTTTAEQITRSATSANTSVLYPPNPVMKANALILSALVALLALSECNARQLQVKQAAAAVQGGCNQLEVRAPNCPGLEACFFWRKAYSGCDNCVASYHNGCYEIGEDYTPLDGPSPRVNVEEAVFYRFGQKVIPGHPNKSYHLVLKYACIDGMLRGTINC